eukprot:s617_g3.t1
MLSPKGALAKSGEGSNSSKSIRWGNVGTLPTGLSDTELLEHFTKRLPENQDTLRKPLTLCEQLELLQSQTECRRSSGTTRYLKPKGKFPLGKECHRDVDPSVGIRIVAGSGGCQSPQVPWAVVGERIEREYASTCSSEAWKLVATRVAMGEGDQEGCKGEISRDTGRSGAGPIHL